MVPALLHGKLSREQENMEDILTSTVFGILRYLPPDEGLLPLLRKSRTVDGQTCSIPEIGARTRVEYEFWPKLKERGRHGDAEFECHFCEPDLLLKIHLDNDEKHYVLIEAKLHSGKSSGPSEDPVAPHDQLAKEWDNLTCLAAADHAEPLLIFLTADFSIPKEQIRESEDEYARKRHGGRLACAWLSWRDIPIVFRDAADDRLQDLVKLCMRLDLRFFDRSIRFESIPEISWLFDRNELQFIWLSRSPHNISWSYQK